MRSNSNDVAEGEKEATTESIRRRPFLGALGGIGLASGVAGRVGAQEDDDGGEWPEPDDPYYAGLVGDLAEMGLPPAEFVHGDTESDARSQYWAGTEGFGTANNLDVSGDEVPFSEATRFEITEEPENNWDVQLRTAEWASDPYRSVEEGQVMLGVAYLRAPEGNGTAQYVADIEAVDDPWNFVASDDYQEPPTEWQRYFFPIEFGAAADGSAYEWSVQFHLGFDVQTVDVGGVALFDFGQSVAASDLPSGAVSDDYEGGDEDGEDEPDEVIEEWPDVDDEYYAGLVDELSNLDIAPGRFVYAENEADTLAAYELAGSHAEISDREALDVSDDDVPFSEATRIEVGELEDESIDPWAVNFNGPVETRDITADSTLLGVAYLRTPQISNANVTYKASDADNEASNYALNGGVSAGQEWERYFFPIDFQSSADAGDWWTEFWVGAENQIVDIGGVALFDFAQGVDPNELPSWDDELDLAENWEEEADERIQEHRTADLSVSVTDADGEPVDTEVAVEMVEHDFTFGTAVDATRLQEDSEDAEQYRELVPELFNTTVLENHHKWRFFEEEQETADAATEWILEQDLDIRGHVALWGSRSSYAVPADVEDAIDEGDAEYVRQRTHEHIETIISHYGDDMEHWDVVNEVIHEPEMIELLDGEDVDPVEAPALAEWYRTATEVAPEGVDLDVNDYNVLAGPYEGTRSDYERQIEFLADAEGVDLGGIGLQSHFSRGEQLTPTQILEALDRYAEAGDGAGIRITEFDMGDPNWLEADKAEFFHWFLKTVFSHEDVEDFVMWGFWDDDHWEDDAPLFYSDWSPKPTYDAYTDLVFEEWWTDETGTTGEEFTTSAFLGEHDLTVSFDDGAVRTSLSIDEPTEHSVDVTVVDIDVLGGGKTEGWIPVLIEGGDSFDPDDLEYDSLRLGSPDAVGAGGGSEAVSLPGSDGEGWGPGKGWGPGEGDGPDFDHGEGNGHGFGRSKGRGPGFGRGKGNGPGFGRGKGPDFDHGKDKGKGKGKGPGFGHGKGRSHRLVHFDADSSDLEDVAMLFGRTEDGSIVVGFDDL